MPRPKVLHVLEATLGGARRHVTDLLLGLDQHKYELLFAFSPLRADALFSEELAKIRRSGVRTVEIPMAREIRPLLDARAFRQLYRLIRNERIAVAHLHSSKAGFLGRLAAKAASQSCKTIYTPHGVAVRLGKFYGLLEKFAGRFTDALIAVSEPERKELAGYGLVASDRLVTISAGIDLSALAALADPSADTSDVGSVRRELGVPLDAPLIGTAGRLTRLKDPEAFVRVGAAVAQAHPEAYFLWVGEGELQALVLSQAATLGVRDRVLFLSFRKDIYRILRAMDIFVLTSIYESFGYVTCEAMALEKAVVATAVAGTVDLVEPGVTGFLVPPGDSQAMARAISILLEEPAKRKAMGQEGRRKIEQSFTVARMVRQTEDLYDRLLARLWGGTSRRVE